MASSNGPETRPATPADLIGFGELRELLGVARSRAHTISRDRDFPPPWYAGEKERLWLRADVEAWLDRHRPGWRQTTG
ncbi:AlpA family transcriptional regulator [Frankia sp. ArI3]|uniref:helix-turn-helix transcriptional regulator n=1 Tax=Frankia sp. ArI3 TaxID=1858 RepID=UPI001C6FCB83|nr:AlpA family phage regulatory protein [Frankia sp. ArI3]